MQLSGRFSEALSYASELHASQTRKGSDVPYLAHLLSVAAIVLEHGATEDEAIAALLHDAIEDQGGAATRDEIRPPVRHRRGRDCRRLHRRRHDSQAAVAPAEGKIPGRPGCAPAARCTWCAPPTSCTTPARWSPTIARHGESLVGPLHAAASGGTLWYYRSIADALAAAQCAALVEELDRVVAELERMAGETSKK